MEGLESFMGFIQVLYIIGIVVIAMGMLFKRRFVAAIAFMLMAPLPLLLINYIFDGYIKEISAFSPEPKTGPTPSPEPAAPVEPFNWEPFMIGGGILGAVSVIVLMLVYGIKAYRKLQLVLEEKAQVEKEKTMQWNQLRETYENSLQIIFNYETDLKLALQYPAMNNSQDKYTAKMLRSAQKAKEVNAAVQSDGIGGSDELLHQYSEIVHEFEEDVSLAKLNAEKTALGFLSDEQRKDFKLAMSLLNHASSEGTPDKSRVNLLEKLKDTIERINKRSVANLVPNKTMHAIEKIKQKELTA